MNAESSRSHLLMSLVIRCKNRRTGVETRGKLTLVDLAGSERVDKSGAKGAQLKEAQGINKSLSAIGGLGEPQEGRHLCSPASCQLCRRPTHQRVATSTAFTPALAFTRRCDQRPHLGVKALPVQEPSVNDAHERLTRRKLENGMGSLTANRSRPLSLARLTPPFPPPPVLHLPSPALPRHPTITVAHVDAAVTEGSLTYVHLPTQHNDHR